MNKLLTLYHSVELNTIGLGIKNEKDPEKILVKEAVKNLRKLMVDQGTIFRYMCQSYLKF